MSASAISKTLPMASRADLLQTLGYTRKMRNEWLRRQIIQNRRTDILAEAVLGYLVKPHHFRILQHQATHPQSLTLVFRGAGKTTVGTIAQAIHALLINPNLRLLLASKTAENAEDFLKEIKTQFETNELLNELFGNYVGTDHWGVSSIDVRPRTKHTKEPSINTIGISGSVASKHYDMIFADDLADEENSRTKTRRDHIRDWYYTALTPCLEPPDPDVRLRGEFHHLGTRYHFEDIWGHLIKNELADHTLTIPALERDHVTGEETSTWPEKFTTEYLKALRPRFGVIRFNSQYQCDTEAMKGEIFRYDDCHIVEEVEIPTTGLITYMGIDLAIGEASSADMFAITAIDRDLIGNVWTKDFFEGHLRFSEQTAKIIEFAKQHKPMRTAIETNAYQRAQYQELRAKEPTLNLLPVNQDKDKVTRAMKLSGLFEAGRVHFRKAHYPLMEHLVMFPGYRYKDLFDSFDLAVQASQARVRKKRSKEPGLL